MLVRAQHEGYKIREVPVSWRENSTTKFDFSTDSYEMGLKIIKLWLDLNKEKKCPGACKDDSTDGIMPCTKETR
jgi:hypothetical protein